MGAALCRRFFKSTPPENPSRPELADFSEISDTAMPSSTNKKNELGIVFGEVEDDQLVIHPIMNDAWKRLKIYSPVILEFVDFKFSRVLLSAEGMTFKRAKSYLHQSEYQTTESRQIIKAILLPALNICLDKSGHNNLKIEKLMRQIFKNMNSLQLRQNYCPPNHAG